MSNAKFTILQRSMNVVVVISEEEMETEHAVIKTPFSNYGIFVSSKVLSPRANLS